MHSRKRKKSDKRKVCVVVASRANYGRIKTVISAVHNHPDLELQLIVSASALLERFGSAVNIIRKDGFEPDATVYMVLEGETPLTMAKSTGLAVIELSSVFDQLKPDIVVTVADRYETIATAVAAAYMNIPVAHTQGGEVTGSIDESVRHAVTKLSHVHFAATELSRERLLRMGEQPDRVFNTGCPSIDIVANSDLSMPGDVISRRGVGVPIDPDSRYLLVIQHPVTTEYESTEAQIEATIEAIDRIRRPTLWLWPNADAGSDIISKHLRVFREQRSPSYLHLVRNFEPETFIRVMNASGCVIGNTSSSIREGAYLGVPAVNIGSRQFGRERGPNVIDVDYRADAIEAIVTQLKHGPYERCEIYGDGQSGKRIADLLATVPLSPVQKTLTY